MKMKMRAAVFTGIKTIEMSDVEKPTARKGEIILRVRTSAVCGTDIRMWANANCKLPLILGHEMAGQIDSIGDGVEGYTVGQRVAVAPNMGCGICDECVSGRTHLCPEYRALAWNMLFELDNIIWACEGDTLSMLSTYILSNTLV